MEELSSKAAEILELAFLNISDAHYEDKAEIQIGNSFTIIDRIEFEELRQTLIDNGIASDSVMYKEFSDVVKIEDPDEYWRNILEYALEYLRNAVADEAAPLAEKMCETGKSARSIDPDTVDMIVDELSLFSSKYRLPEGFWKNVTDIDTIIEHI